MSEPEIVKEEVVDKERQEFLTIREGQDGAVLYKIEEDELQNALLQCLTLLQFVKTLTTNHGIKMTFATITGTEEEEFAKTMRDFSRNESPNDAMFELEIQKRRLALHLRVIEFPSGEIFNLKEKDIETRLKVLSGFPNPVQRMLYSFYFVFSEILRRAVIDSATLKN